MEHSILLVEDDELLAENIQTYLERKDFEVTVCHSAEDALGQLESFMPDIVLTDNSLPGMSGHDLIQKLRISAPELKVIMMTGYGNVEDAVVAMKEGAFHYVTKPVALPELKLLLDKALATERMERTLSFYQEREAQKSGVQALIGESSPMQYLKNTIGQLLDAERRMANTDLPPVLVEGETGTGKELVARALHFDGPRSKGPFIEFNCASIPSNLVESELFGHEKGAFTDAKDRRVGLVEAADGGTLFLDEIGELPLEAQARLLRVLQEGEIRRVGSVQSQKVDVRLIAATHRDLKSLAKIGQFREDLYYRLHVIALKLPALRERGADVNEIANAFLARQSARINRTDLKFAADAEQAIRHYSWPGNVRELENAVERAVILSESPEISADLLGIDIELGDLEDDEFIGLPAQTAGNASNSSHEPTEDLSLEDYFQHFVLEHQDHMTETELARKLGVSRKCLWERRQRLGIPRRKTGVASES